MKVGKLTNPELIECVLSVIKKRREEVKVSSSLAQDCASFEIGERILISTDPITGAEENAGKLAIKINANDICAAGGEPVLATVTILAPPDTSLEKIKKLMVSTEAYAEKNNVEIVGGHTEFTDAVNRIVVSVTMIGKTIRHITANSAKANDNIIITKTVGIEGTAILVGDYENKLRQFLNEEEIQQAKQLGRSIGIQKEASIAKEFDINAMHDITEGGVFGAIVEMAEASQVGAYIEVEKIKIHPVTQKLCLSLDIDPYRLISSGSLLISTPKPQPLLDALRKNGIEAEIIGKFTEQTDVIADFGESRENIQTKQDQLSLAIKRCK